mgnify:CR=1 FL=1
MDKIQYLLFDLDDTLYTNTSGLFVEVGARIESWTARTLGIHPDEARALRRRYYTAYGTTMAGLLREHADVVDIDSYLNYVHDVDVSRYLTPSPDLASMLQALPVSKAVFTNSITSWAERVTTQLGIRQCFDTIFDVRAVDYHSKPDPHAYSKVLNTLGLPGEACVMLDDQASYLAGAARAGMRTIWVREGGTATDGIDYAVDHVLDSGPILRRLLGLQA